ncbi:hypothetical protein [Aestuariibacter sp. A3R04]|uniref:hypothetical protein n=1 Tax=Aestuariibacter sp. A3R04 TaxID=2841571 RepID=UPI001C0A04EA|nr:hypothetical protein [Aestuariibacter sp. A3R04]MBU3020495.1 hypothetical protein [Aestuariibacter sp. A3R04]
MSFIRISALVVFAMWASTGFARDVRIEGYSILAVTQVSDSDKEQQVSEALYQGVLDYYSDTDPNMLHFIETKIPKALMQKNISKLINEYRVDQAFDERGRLVTDVVASFKKSDFEQRLQKLASSREEITLVVVEFLQSTEQRLSAARSTFSLPLSESLSGGNLVVSTQYDELSDRTGGMFNFGLMEKEFVNSGNVAIAPLNAAAKAKAGGAKAYSAIVTHTLTFVGVDNLRQEIHQVKLHSTATIINAHTNERTTLEVANTLGEGESEALATQSGINIASRKLAGKIKSHFLQKL